MEDLFNLKKNITNIRILLTNLIRTTKFIFNIFSNKYILFNTNNILSIT